MTAHAVTLKVVASVPKDCSFWTEDDHGKIITLNSEVLISGCGTSSHTAFLFAQSLEPRDGEMWKQLDAIRDTFRCSR
jgi:hypothetical protein